MLTLVPPYGSLEYKKFTKTLGGTMTNEELVILHQSIPKFMDIGSTKFAYAIMKNKRLLEQEVKQIQKQQIFDPDWTVYNTAREDLAKEHCDKDEDGKPVIVQSPAGSQYKITKIEDFEKLFNELKEKNAEAIAKQDVLNDNFEKLIETESTLELYKISKDILPEDLSGKDLEILENIIIE